MFNFGGMSGGTGFQFGTTTSSNASTSNTGGLQSTGEILDSVAFRRTFKVLNKNSKYQITLIPPYNRCMILHFMLSLH